MRSAEENLQILTGYKLKVVERSGAKLEDILHSSNPWSGKDCGRNNCLLCVTKIQQKKEEDNAAEKGMSSMKCGVESVRQD